MAIRRQRFTAAERREFNAGQVVTRDGESLRRTDFEQRVAEIEALKRAMHQNKV